MITVDKDLPFQQNIEGWKIMVIVLAAEGNDIKALLPLVPALKETLNEIRPGKFVILK